MITYIAKKLEKIDNGTRDGMKCWDTLRIGVFEFNEETKEEKQVGEYERNYSSLYETFCPFKQKDKWYALYSPDYTATRVMSLPDCKDLGGEEADGCGFCPVEFYVPWDDHELKYEDPDQLGQFGFVAGCIWGDDCSWKIRHIDLSKVSEGKLTVDNRYGYLELGASSLKKAISFHWWSKDEEGYEPGDGHNIIITCASSFNMKTGKSNA